jgi:hypothetical protein
MKSNIINLIGIACFGIFSTSCSNFLDIAPQNAVVPSNFFQNESDFRQAVDGAYAPLQVLYNSRSSWAMGEMRSDNTHFFYNMDFRSPIPEEIDMFTNGSENTVSADRYYLNYDIIARSNQVLAVIDEASLEESIYKNLKGQVLFLRALAYFDLVRYYGGVPLHLVPANDLASSSLPRSTEEQIYAQILSDAEQAATMLPQKSQQEAGRATAGAAWTLLADAHITLKKWNDAAAALSNITGYSLLPDYGSVYSPTNKNNAESVFEVQYLEGTSLGLHSIFPYSFVPLTVNHSQLTLGPTGSQSSESAGWNIPTQDLINLYEDQEKDQRFTASIGFHTGPSIISDTSYVNLPYIRKYQHPHSIFQQANQNFPIYRYAEVILMRAEVANESGQTQSALAHLNEVRKRAGLSDYTGTSQDEIRSAIFRERRVELAFENKRWLDLVRSGQAITVMNAHGADLKNDPAYFYLTPATYSLTQKHLLFPIPFQELQVNPDLEQNTGY